MRARDNQEGGDPCAKIAKCPRQLKQRAVEQTTRNGRQGTDDADAAIVTILSLVKASRYKVPGANQCVYIGIYCQMKKPKTTKKRVAI